MNHKFLLLTLLLPSLSVCQQYRPDSGLRAGSVFLNYSNSIFNRPIEEFKYVNTPNGIQIYETYRHPANGSINQTIFPKPMPIAIIKTNTVTKSTVIYKTYSNSIFNKPIEFSTITPAAIPAKKIQQPHNLNKNLPKYNGEGDIDYGE